jgi:hypothetical protein
MRLYLTLLLWSVVLGACETGPDQYFGRAPVDAGARDARVTDARAAPDSDMEGHQDDDEQPCATSKDCAAFADTPYCHPGMGLCAECLQDDDCESGQACDAEGECSPDR